MFQVTLSPIRPRVVQTQFGLKSLEPSATMALPPVDQEKLLATFLDMAKISSPSGHEEPVRHYIETRLNRLGLKPQYEVDKSGNLLLTLPAHQSRSNKTLLITAHMDTVSPCENIVPQIEGSGDDRVVKSSGNSILGADDKSALAGILEALEISLKHNLPRPKLIFAITTREEIGALGAAEIDPKKYQGADLAIAIDHTGEQGTIVYHAPQITGVYVTVHGQAAHSGIEPEKGVNALMAWSKAMANMRLGRLDSDTTANIGLLQSGERMNIIPQQVKATGEIRSLYPERVNEELEHMKQQLQHGTAQVPGSRFDFEHKTLIHGYQTPMDHQNLKPMLQAIKELGLPCLPRKTNGGSDVNVFAQHGIPSVVWSAGFINPHQLDEHVKLKDMTTITRLLLQTWNNYALSA